MTNQQGIAIASVLIIVAVLVIVSILGYVLFQASNTTDSDNANVTTVNSLANENTNAVANVNTVINTNSATNVNTSLNINGSSDWDNYSSTKYGYSIKYPSTWFNLPNYGAPDTDKYFSNKNIGAPLEMGLDGIWITIRVSENNEGLSLSEWASRSPGSPQSIISNVINITINDTPAIQQVEDYTKAEGTEGGYSLATYLMKGETVYSIKSLTFNSETSDTYKEIYNLMADSFTLTE